LARLDAAQSQRQDRPHPADGRHPLKPAGPIPPGYAAGADGRLAIGGRSVEDLAAGGTPLFVYDRSRIAAQAARLRSAMPADVALHYAVKANPYEPLLREIGTLVDGFDIASAGELDRLGGTRLPVSFA